MAAGLVPLVLRTPAESSVRDFCKHVDTQISEAVRHQRFPVHALERGAHTADRIVINFFPAAFTLDFGGAPASANMTNSGLAGSTGFTFSGLGDELFLSTLGDRSPVRGLGCRRGDEAPAGGVGGDDCGSGAAVVVD